MKLDKKAIIGLIVVGVVMVLVIAGSLLGGPYSPNQQASSSTPTSQPEEVEPEPQKPQNITEQGAGITEVQGVTETVDFFRNQKGKLQLGGELHYPDSTLSAGASYVGIGDKFTVGLTKNWLVNLDSNTLNAVHTTGPSICIMQTALYDKFFTDVVDQQLSDYLSANGIEQGTVTDIFYNDKVVGRMSSAPITIDDENYILDAGIFLLSKEVYQLVSVYPVETEETVINFYNSIKYSNKAVVLK